MASERPRKTLCVNDLVELTTFPSGHKPRAYITRFDGPDALVALRDRLTDGTLDIPAGTEFTIPRAELTLINPDAFITLAWR